MGQSPCRNLYRSTRLEKSPRLPSLDHRRVTASCREVCLPSPASCPILYAVLCMDSSRFWRSVWRGLQMVAQYPRTGSTRAVYSIQKAWCGMALDVRAMNPLSTFALGPGFCPTYQVQRQHSVHVPHRTVVWQSRCDNLCKSPIGHQKLRK